MLNGPFQNGFQNGQFLQGFAKRKGVSDLGKKKAQKSSQEIFEAILLSDDYSGIFPTMYTSAQILIALPCNSHVNNLSVK